MVMVLVVGWVMLSLSGSGSASVSESRKYSSCVAGEFCPDKALNMYSWENLILMLNQT